MLGIMLIAGCNVKTSGNAPCSWVYKTRDDYSDYLGGGVNLKQNIVATVPGFSKGMKALDKGYYTSVYGCTKDYVEGSVFFDVTTDEWNSGWTDTHDTSDLIHHVMDDDPFTELYFCKAASGGEMTLNEQQLNDIIDSDRLGTKCEKII